MKPNELDHKIERFSALAEHDEALAKILLASAAEKREMVDAMKAMQMEIQSLKEKRQTTLITNQIGTINGNYIETINNANLCQPSSTTSTEHMSSISTPTYKTNIIPLRQNK